MDPREEIINEIVEKGVFEAIGDGISIQDTNFKILYQNNIHKKIIGNHVGEYCYNAYEKNEKVCTGCPLADTYKDGEIHTRERCAPTEKGTIYVEITSSPIKVPSGEIIAGVEVVRDITERKNLEDKFRNLAESVSELIYRADPDTFVTTYVNKSVEQIYGYTVEEWRNNPELWEKTIHPDDKERVFAKIKEAQNKYEPIIIEYRIIRKDASVRWGKDHISWEKDNDGNVISLNGIMYDITERKKIQEDLTEKTELMKLSLEGTDEGLWDWDVKSGLIIFDDNWQRILGYTPGEVGFNFDWWKKSIHPDSKSVFEIALNAYLESSNKYYELEYQIKTKSGDWKWIWARGICLTYDEQGKPLRMIGTHRDITERKQAEQETMRRMEELETFYQVSIKRELKMKQLKEEIEKLKSELSKYKK